MTEETIITLVSEMAFAAVFLILYIREVGEHKKTKDEHIVYLRAQLERASQHHPQEVKHDEQ